MRRRIASIGLLVVLLVLLLVPASADMIVAPYNYYFSAHPSSLTEVGFYYSVPSGMTVSVYQNPEEGGLLHTLSDGDTIYISHSCSIRDTIWGFAQQIGGWVRLGRLQRIYSHEEFVVDYGSQLTHLPNITLNRADYSEPILSWTYPGSGQQSNCLMPSETTDIVNFQAIYNDEMGGRWAHVGFHYGRIDWVYLDDPCNPDPPFRLNIQLENTVTDTSPTETDPVPPRSFFSTFLWPVLLVSAVVMLTGLSIYALKLSAKK